MCATNVCACVSVCLLLCVCVCVCVCVWRTPHLALSPQEVRYDVGADIGLEDSGTLVVISCVDQELPARVLIDERAHLTPQQTVQSVILCV